MASPSDKEPQTTPHGANEASHAEHGLRSHLPPIYHPTHLPPHSVAFPHIPSTSHSENPAKYPSGLKVQAPHFPVLPSTYVSELPGRLPGLPTPHSEAIHRVEIELEKGHEGGPGKIGGEGGLQEELGRDASRSGKGSVKEVEAKMKSIGQSDTEHSAAELDAFPESSGSTGRRLSQQLAKAAVALVDEEFGIFE